MNVSCIPPLHPDFLETPFYRSFHTQRTFPSLPFLLPSCAPFVLLPPIAMFPLCAASSRFLPHLVILGCIALAIISMTSLLSSPSFRERASQRLFARVAVHGLNSAATRAASSR